MAYESIKQKLSECLQRKDLFALQISRLKHFQALFDFYIPCCLRYMLSIRHPNEEVRDREAHFLLIAIMSLRSNNYARALLLSLSIRRYWRLTDHPASFIEGPCINEETGEILLSNLAGSVHQLGQFADTDSTSVNFQKVGLARVTSSELFDQLNFKTDSMSKERRGRVSPDDPRIPKLARKMNDLIESILENTWKQYPVLGSGKHFYERAASVQLVQEGRFVPTLITLNWDFENDLRKLVNEVNSLNSPPLVRRDESSEESSSSVVDSDLLPESFYIESHEIRAGSYFYTIVDRNTERKQQCRENDLPEEAIDEYWEGGEDEGDDGFNETY